MAINKKSPNEVTLPITTVSSSKTETKEGLVKPDSISQRKKGRLTKRESRSQRRKRICQRHLMSINKK